MPKYSRVQFNFHCRTCDIKIQLSIYYGQSSIWNNKDAGKLAQWQMHEGHDTNLVYKFVEGDKDMRSYTGPILDMPLPSKK